MSKGSHYQPPQPKTKLCEGCGEPYLSRSNRGRFCTNKCGQMFRRLGTAPKRSGRRCVTCECPIPAEASLHTKYCGADCQPSFRPDGREPTLPRKLRTRTVGCAYCGKLFTTANTLQKYCSQWCSDTGYTCRTDKTAYERRLGRTCVRCGTRIPDSERVNKKFCTESCQVCFNQELRRARKRGLPVERVSRAEIFERDNYTCHICMEPIEDKPVLDHLIPLAIKGSPGHVRENLAAAHAYCNCSKNARVRPEDYRLYIELSLGGSISA